MNLARLIQLERRLIYHDLASQRLYSAMPIQFQMQHRQALMGYGGLGEIQRRSRAPIPVMQGVLAPCSGLLQPTDKYTPSL